jgi:hypothetical protein
MCILHIVSYMYVFFFSISYKEKLHAGLSFHKLAMIIWRLSPKNNSKENVGQANSLA